MNARHLNRSHRLLFINGSLDILLWASEEAKRQFAEARQERRARFFASLAGARVEVCPCGCGLKGDVCDSHIATVNTRNEQIPF